MNKIALQIPIKFKPSERIHNKNFINLCGKPFYSWLLDKLINNIPENWDVYIDSENEKVFNIINERYKENKFKFHKRNEYYSENWANGNHLLHQFAISNPKYDLYCQLFITAVNLEFTTIKSCIDNFLKKENHENYDSSFLVTKETGWVWFDGMPINYNHSLINGLPRSQDAQYYKETTGMYIVKKNTLFENGCRIGKKPLLYSINEKESFDIDTIEDIAKFKNQKRLE
jgi:CMP-N-acetylneuraminic acid synthetase